MIFTLSSLQFSTFLLSLNQAMHLTCLSAQMLTQELMLLVWEDLRRLSSMPAQLHSPEETAFRGAKTQWKSSRQPSLALLTCISTAFLFLAGLGCAVWASRTLSSFLDDNLLSVPEPLRQRSHPSINKCQGEGLFVLGMTSTGLEELACKLVHAE